MKMGILLGYFNQKKEARAAYKKLKRKGYSRVAWIHKDADSKIQIHDPFLGRMIFCLMAFFITFVFLAILLSNNINEVLNISSYAFSQLIFIFGSGFLGSFLSLILIRRSWFGVDKKLINDHAQWLSDDETVLLLQAPIEKIKRPSTLLLKSSQVPPIIFVLHPKRDCPIKEKWHSKIPFTTEQLQEQAQRLAANHVIDQKPLRDTRLLKHLKQSRRWVHLACHDLAEANRLDQSLNPTDEWLLDNEYLFESNARDILLNLPKDHYQQLPALETGPFKGLPRIYGMARDFVSCTDFRIDEDNILSFFEAYQAKKPLSIAELWTAPQMLRAAIIEGIRHLSERSLKALRDGELADFWAHRLIAASRRNTKQLFAILANLTKTQTQPSLHFGSQLIDCLYDEGAVLAPVQSWLENTFNKSFAELSLREKNHEMKDQVSIGNAFTSLRQLALIDWKVLFEKLSVVEKLLREDPSGFYSKMDFTTRDRCRRAVEELHRGSSLTEEQVAQKANEQASLNHLEKTDDERHAHVGTYLIGQKRKDLANIIECKEKLGHRLLHWIYAHHSAVYFLSLGGFFFLFFSLILLLGFNELSYNVRAVLAFLIIIPVSQLALDFVNYIITRFFPPRVLPKMDYKKTGIPDTCQTLVVVPMMLVNLETIQAEANKLEIRYLKNKENNLYFGLLSDFTDANTIKTKEDAKLVDAAIKAIETLNQRYGTDQFYLFHRERQWSKSEQKYIGWERKRGKLEELNDFITGARPNDAKRFVYVGDPNQLTNVRFVITLDSDTELPHDAARRMIETISHPLNLPRFNNKGQIMSGTYALIQPRVTPSLPSASKSTFSRFFSNPVGVDPYTNVVSDVYQDLVGEGSYHGKGIYDVRAFSKILSQRFPEACLLSHDLIEGAHVRVAFASDIELFDDFPQDYVTFVKRQHRWVRGDWQILDWITPRVPGHDGHKTKNPLSLFDRWKVFDNLRRSLLPTACLVLLLASWAVSYQAGLIASALVIIQFLFHSLAQHFTWATTHKGFKSVSFSKINTDLLRVMVEASLLPYQSWMNMDAIVRSLYRRFISHKHLLEWTTAQMAESKAQTEVSKYLFSIGLTSITSIVLAILCYSFAPDKLLLISPWLCVWFLSPLAAWVLNRRPKIKQLQSLISEEDRLFLRNISRRTWRYFSDFVNETTSWLPPDNYQVSHQNQLAMRTSPTNIGLWMVSALSAHQFGYITIDEIAHKLSKTFETLNKLECYEGHLLNWYDIQTLAPLNPRYVSTVDSGNFLGALWTLKRGIHELTHVPLLNTKAFDGLCDTGHILLEYANKESKINFDVQELEQLIQKWNISHHCIVDVLATLWETKKTVLNIAKLASESPEKSEHIIYWADQLKSQLMSWLDIYDRYLSWIDVLNEKTDEELKYLGRDVLSEISITIEQAPSLVDLASGNVPVIKTLETLRHNNLTLDDSLIEWLDHVLTAFSRSKWLAGEVLAVTEQLKNHCAELSESINMKFLYNTERKLFSIGYNVSEGHLDRSFYDLLASEARLGSFIAIARGEIPVEHWFDMTRPYGAVGRRRVLLSWTGTMFEYLMPLLFQRSYWNTLLNKAAHEAVAVQIAYGRKNRVPWGISESAFGDLDIHKTYQYYAFGVPSLGLKRGQAEKIVVAPYASLLAVNLAPEETLKNLKRLSKLGLYSGHGFFEAIDFSRQTRRGKRGVIVRTYMAHHQGMSFLSLTNFLHNNPLHRYFHEDRRVRAVEPLLYERIPTLPNVHHIATREREASVALVGEAPPTVRRFETPHTQTPKTQLLSNNSYALMVTNAGGGYSRWGDFEITRWRADLTRDSFGTFCYIHDTDSNQVWSNTHLPTCIDVDTYQATFTPDRAVFQRIDHNIEIETEIIISPDDDVEIRRITIINRSSEERNLNLTSYIELALAPHNADRQHPAFNKLFIQTEAVYDHQAIMASRRPRKDDETPVYVAHSLTLENLKKDALTFETDRRQFIGRGRTLANPMGAEQNLNNTQGYVLDPILSLRTNITLDPEQRTQVSLVLAAAESHTQALNLISKYSSPHIIEHAMDLVWAAAQVELRLLRIHSDEARRFQQLAGHLLFPDPMLRSPAKRIMENHKGQSGLWTYGISGDLPIVLVIIGESRDLLFVRQILQAHNYWRMHGLMADLVIINEEANSYEQPLREKLERMIMTLATSTGTEQPGGVFLRSAGLIPKEDLILMRAVAHVVMIAARGALPQQMGGVSPNAPDLPKLLVKKLSPRDRSAALPFLELDYFNSLGGFTQDGREYAIYLGPDLSTPAPWVNVIANNHFGTMISETGAGFTWQGNSQRNRLTEWSNDPVTDSSSETIYIRDEETGRYWTPTASPIREKTAYRAKHGAGYSLFEHNSHGINQELTVFVPMTEQGGEPVKLQKLKLYNDSNRSRTLSLTYYVELTLGENHESSQMHIVTDWDDDLQVLTARNSYNPDYPNEIAFVALDLLPDSYTGDRTIFLGRNRSMKKPLAMERVNLSGRTGAGFDPCAALQTTVKLAPGEQTELVCLLGQTPSLEQARKLILNYRRKHSFETALVKTKEWWDKQLNTIQIKTPDLSTNLMVNRWLLYQTLSCRIWARSAFYQSGGAFGFRDQLQDVMALLYTQPSLAREHILLAASRQFKEGDVQHWWHPPGGAGIRSRISDDLLWLPYVVAQYVKVTGDHSILNQTVSFLSADELQDDQHELFLLPEKAAEQGTLFEHCHRAVTRSQKFGVHGLPLMGTGDWNDGMNLVGAQGKGESVWLAWFMVEVLERMAEMATTLNKTDLQQTYLLEKAALVQRIEDFAWDGEWYLRATFDDGTLLGSKQNAEAKIDSLSQSWAWLCGAARKDRAQQALDAAWHHLVNEDESLILLFTPPFNKSEPSPGYIKGYPPGVRENGGQYTHAALWLAMAMAKSGDGTRAAKMLQLINPIERSKNPEAVWRYNVEPYVIAADVYHLKDRIGMGGWSWYTGSASWMYRAWIEDCLGLKIRGNTLEINPVIPKKWAGFQMSYQHKKALYEIHVENPDHCEKDVLWVELDGRKIPDKKITLDDDLVKHKIVVRMGKSISFN